MAPPARAAAVSGREPSCLPTHSLSAAALRERPQVRAAQEAGDRPASRWSPRSWPRSRTLQRAPWRRSMTAANCLGSTKSKSASASKSLTADFSLPSPSTTLTLYEKMFANASVNSHQSILASHQAHPDTPFLVLTSPVLPFPVPPSQTHPRHPLPRPSPSQTVLDQILR